MKLSSVSSPLLAKVAVYNMSPILAIETLCLLPVCGGVDVKSASVVVPCNISKYTVLGGILVPSTENTTVSPSPATALSTSIVYVGTISLITIVSLREAPDTVFVTIKVAVESPS